MQKWITSNLTALVAAGALICGLASGLFVTIAQIRCTLLEEDIARLKGRLQEAVETLKEEQDSENKAVLGVVNETVKRVATLAETKEAAETPEEEKPKEEPAGGVE